MKLANLVTFQMQSHYLLLIGFSDDPGYRKICLKFYEGYMNHVHNRSVYVLCSKGKASAGHFF